MLFNSATSALPAPKRPLSTISNSVSQCRQKPNATHKRPPPESIYDGKNGSSTTLGPMGRDTVSAASSSMGPSTRGSKENPLILKQSGNSKVRGKVAHTSKGISNNQTPFFGHPDKLFSDHKAENRIRPVHLSRKPDQYKASQNKRKNPKDPNQTKGEQKRSFVIRNY